MKKATLALAAGLLIFSSCKKDWTCTCTNSDGLQSSTVYEDTKKADAKASCDALENLAIVFDPGSSCSVD